MIVASSLSPHPWARVLFPLVGVYFAFAGTYMLKNGRFPTIAGPQGKVPAFDRLVGGVGALLFAAAFVLVGALMWQGRW
jgi:hypothetical protein